MQKSQEQIVFEHVCIEMCLGEYRRSPYQSVGQIIHYLRAYGLRNYETVQIGFKNGVGEVISWGNVIATYVFDDIRKMPVFKFEKHEYVQRHQDLYLAGLDRFENPYAKYNYEPQRKA